MKILVVCLLVSNVFTFMAADFPHTYKMKLMRLGSFPGGPTFNQSKESIVRTRLNLLRQGYEEGELLECVAWVRNRLTRLLKLQGADQPALDHVNNACSEEEQYVNAAFVRVRAA